MTTALFVSQLLNGLQFGVIPFLVAAGLTLVFGVMDFINLAHGVQYMIGAYLVAVATASTGNFAIGLITGLFGALVLGVVLETLVFRHLTRKDHLDQVLATFASSWWSRNWRGSCSARRPSPSPFRPRSAAR